MISQKMFQPALLARRELLPTLRSMRLLWIFSGDTKSSSKFGRYSIVEPADVAPAHYVPEHIEKPPWALTGVPLPPPDAPEVKAAEVVVRMRAACRLASKILHSAKNLARPGVTTESIDRFVHQMTVNSGAYPSPLNYRGFPKSVCTSVNNVACHGIPDSRPLEEGDIINIDVTVFLDGVNGDCSATFPVGEVDSKGQKLIAAAVTCLQKAIAVCKPGAAFSDIGAAVEMAAEFTDHTVVPAFVGHGIGTYFHGPPDIYHCWNSYPGVMQRGMTFTIEPVISQGARQVEVLEDGWTAVSLDGSRSAQFEHTVLITRSGVEVLTEPPAS